MATTLSFDFRHFYSKGDRRESEQIAYQWDLGHIAEIYVPVNAAYTINYCFLGYERTEDYAVESIEAASDGGYKLIAHVPNRLFERSGELRLYIVGSVDGHVMTTYEGFTNIRSRVKPDDYTDDDPENGAETIIARARRYADESEAWAVGQIEGADVPSTAPQYQNNAKYHAEQAAAEATDASSSASAAASSESSAAGSASTATTKASEASTSAGNAASSATAAAGSASAAAGSATTASNHAQTSEAWAVGTKNGAAVPSGADQYQNNAKYWAEQAAKTCRVNMGTISSLPVTKTATGVTADMVVVESVLGTPSAQTNDWTITTAANSITVSGSISGSTTLTLILSEPIEITAT